MYDEFQFTIAREFSVTGIGLHSGESAEVTIRPARAEAGITLSLEGGIPVRAAADVVAKVPLCTRVITPSGQIDTVEHMMAALTILGVDNAEIVVSGPEVPILDGSSAPWREAIVGAGLVRQEALRRHFVVTRHFHFAIGESSFVAVPGGQEVTVTIDFPGTAVGRQSATLPWREADSIMDARTFTFEAELPYLRKMGLAKGGSLENAVVVGADGPLNEGGLRSPDEFVRHKALDLIGDLSFAGGPIRGGIEAFRPGHAANSAFLNAMLDEGVIVAGVPSRARRAA